MSQRPELLQIGPLMGLIDSGLAERFVVERLWEQPDRAAFLAEHGARFRAVATSAVHGASADVIAALPKLEVISSFGVGYDTIDVRAAAARGVAVGYTPDVLNDCVADLAFGLMIDAARQITAADRFLRRGEWTLDHRYPLAVKVSGKRLGILGLGRIGRTIARRAAGFDMAVRYTSRRPVPGVDWGHEPSLVELARWADFLVVATAGGAETRGLVSAEVLEALGPQGFLVNIARGSVIDEPALVAALAERRIAGAGLDVFDREPEVPAALIGLDNVVLVPHIASGTHETRRAMAELVLANLDAHFRDGRLVTPVPAP